MIVKGSWVEKMMMMILMVVVMVIGVRLVMQHDMSRWREFLLLLLLLVALTTKTVI